MLRAPSCKVNSTDINIGSKRKKMVATTSRPCITQQMSWFLTVADSLQHFCPRRSFCIYFLKKKKKVLIEHPSDRNHEQTKYAYRFRYFLYFFSFSPSLFPLSFQTRTYTFCR